jgi:hypothetical protein
LPKVRDKIFKDFSSAMFYSGRSRKKVLYSLQSFEGNYNTSIKFCQDREWLLFFFSFHDRQQQIVDEGKIVAKTAEYTVPKITTHIEEVKKWANETLMKIGEQLQQETEKLSEIREAVVIEKKNLEEIHGMRVEANTLADILRAEEEARREREGEERQYEHERDLKRRSEETKYELEQTEKRAQREAEMKRREQLLDEKEKSLKAQEQELVELQKKVEAVPHDIEKAKEEERKKVLAEEAQKAATLAALEAAKHDGERKVQELKIVSLEKQVVEERHEIESLKKQLEQAVEKNQSLAAKVIEGASGMKALKFMEEEREKGGKEEKKG